MQILCDQIGGSQDDANSAEINSYNALNQLINTISNNMEADYFYNSDGLRISKKVNGNTTNHVWDGDQMVLETDGAGNVTNKYIRGINLIYSEDSGANRRYFLYNGHGDTVQLTSATGSSIKTYDYDAFGNEKNPDPNDTNMFRYCGEYFDKETGTIYLRARYYDPTIGRFITEDSYWGKDNDPLSLNLYTYCYSNPINRFDPSGHISQEDAMRISDQLNALGAKSDGVVTQQEAEQIHRIQITSAPKTTQGTGKSGTQSNNKTTTNNKTNPIVKALTGPIPDIWVRRKINNAYWNC